MIKYVYAFKNILSGQFGNPTVEVINSDNAVEAYTAAAREAKGEAKEAMKELDLYYLGTFDTKSGNLELVNPTFLVSLKEVMVDGGEN